MLFLLILGWDYAKYSIQSDSTFSKFENPKPYLLVNNQPLYDMELDKLTTEQITKVDILTGDEAKSFIGSRGKYGAIFIKVKEN